MKEGLNQISDSNEVGPSGLLIEKVQFRPGKEATSIKPNDRDRSSDALIKSNTSNPQALVKGKKGIAQSRASSSIQSNIVEGAKVFGLPLLITSQERSLHEGEEGSDGKQQSGTPTQF